MIVVAVAGAAVLTSGGRSSKPPQRGDRANHSRAEPGGDDPDHDPAARPIGPACQLAGDGARDRAARRATVETLKLGSEADRAGLSPGDVILEINGTRSAAPTGSPRRSAAKHAGDKVAMQISHGSSLYTTVVTLGAPPTRYP